MLTDEVKNMYIETTLVANTTAPDGSATIVFPQRLPPGSDVLLTRAETARLLRATHGYLPHIGDRLLPTIRIGSSVRHRLSDVLALIERRTVDDRRSKGWTDIGQE